MTIKKIPESHTDHSLSALQLLFILSLDAPEGEVHVQTVEMPEKLGTLPCALYGPLMGDRAINDSDVTMAVRGERKGKSRLVTNLPVRQTRLVTVVSGSAEKMGPKTGDSGYIPCALYTAYGGPAMPREPFEFTDDDTSEKAVESREKWATHALCE